MPWETPCCSNCKHSIRTIDPTSWQEGMTCRYDRYPGDVIDVPGGAVYVPPSNFLCDLWAPILPEPSHKSVQTKLSDTEFDR